MAMKMIRQCDFDPSCPQPPDTAVAIRRDGLDLQADLCADHTDVIMETVSFQPVAARVRGKSRDIYTTASGETFSASQARAWLIEKGLKQGGANGRVSNEHLELYAARH